MGVPAAAGYPQYSNNLISPLFSMQLLELFYGKTIYSEISTTAYDGELNRWGDQITFFREPEIAIFDVEKGGDIPHNTISSQPVTMVVDQAKGFSEVISRIDEKQIQNWDAIRAAFLKRGAYNLAINIDRTLLGQMFADADPNNSGTTAGVLSHSYNFGVTGNPVPISSTNITQIFAQVNGALNEQNAPEDNRFIILPPVAEVALMNSDLRAAYLTGESTSTIINGRLPNKVAGFNVYRSTNVPQVFDAGVNAICYNIVAGTQSATAFAAQMDETRVIEGPNSWNKYYQGLAVYGYKVLYPKAIAALYARFN